MVRRFRAALVRLHRYLGLTTAAFLFVAGVTGAILPFHDDLDAALNPELFSANGSAALSPSILAAAVERTDPNARVAFVEVNAAPGRSAILFVEPRDADTEIGYNQVFADPTSGAVLGRRQYGACCLQRAAVIPFLYDLHRRLAMPGHWGDWLIGGVALLWSLDCFIALLLTLPATRPFLARWAPAWRIKATASPTRKIFDLHRAGGLWLWLALLPIALSGVYLNLGTEVFKPLVGLFSPLTPTPYDAPAPPRSAGGPRLGFDAILAKASEYAAARQWRLQVRGIYDDREAGFYVVDFGTGRESGLGPPWIVVDAVSGAVLSEQVPGDGSVGDVIVRTQFPIHSGRILGLPGRILVSVAGLAVALLSVTGVVIWYRKRRSRLHRLGRREDLRPRRGCGRMS
jgi:uncharacterized iron-regulated membrane protein